MLKRKLYTDGLLVPALLAAAALGATGTAAGQIALEVGTEWHYTLGQFAGPPLVNRLALTRDTTVAGLDALIVEATHATCNGMGTRGILRGDGDRVYAWDGTRGTFLLLYDLGAQAGDTIRTERVFPDGQPAAVMIVVDSVGTVELSGYTQRQQKVRIGVANPSGEIEIAPPGGDYAAEVYTKAVIVEGIGASNDPLLVVESGACDWVAHVGLRCASHPSLGEVRYVTEPCDRISDTRDAGPAAALALELVGNPVAGELRLRTVQPLGGDATLRIVDQAGRVVARPRPTAVAGDLLSVDCAALPPGTYVAELTLRGPDGTARRGTARFAKR